MNPHSAPNLLELVQSLPTSGARAASNFRIDGHDYLAIAQLAKDVPNAPRGMNLGDSDVSTVIYRRDQSGTFREFQSLSVPGGEDVEFFSIDGRHFLAVASLRAGKGPYSLDVASVIFEWKTNKFHEFQSIATFGAKQWRYFQILNRHFLALAQGLQLPDVQSNVPSESTIFEWNGSGFVPFQTVPSAWGYNWLHFDLDDQHFLAYADFRSPSILLRWDGSRFIHFKTFEGKGGRAFCFFRADSGAYLAFADIESESVLYRWDGHQFQSHQNLLGPGGREWALIEDEDDIYVVLVRFITGTREAPNVKLDSIIYRMNHGNLEVVQKFTTYGATDAITMKQDRTIFLTVCESLAEDISFRTDTKIYRFISPPKQNSGKNNEVYQSPEFLHLYEAYTGGPETLGSMLAEVVTRTTVADPLLVATASEMIFYPGRGQDPSFVSYRLSNRGFKELASISHIGPALGSLVQIHTANPNSDEWKTEAQTLLESIKMVKDANSTSLWRDKIRTAAYKGREAAIAAMINYSCTISINYLQAVLLDPSKLTSEYLQHEFLEAKGKTLGAVIPFNAVMIATFFLVGLDISYRMRIWLEGQKIDWKRAMVLIVGRQGRETSGVTLTTNSVAQSIIQCSNLDVPLERIYIAPHGPTIALQDASDIDSLRKYGAQARTLWNKLHAIGQLGETMFSGYARYRPQLNNRSVIDDNTTEVAEMPRIRGPDDWLSLSTRMRLVLEDARQLLSGCVTDYAAEQLRQNGGSYADVVVPGLDHFDYANATAGLVTPRQNEGLPKSLQTDGIASLRLHGLDFATKFTATPKKCEVEGGEIAYYEEGPGDHIVIWLHGLPLDSRSWAAQRPFFASRHRNIYMDLRGYGNSSKFPSGVKDVTQVNCDDLQALMNHLNIQSASIVGFASAGHAALRFAAQHPTRVEKLVTINASPCFRQQKDWPFGFSDQAMGKFIDAANHGGIKAITDMVLDAHVVFRDLGPDDSKQVQSFFREMSYEASLDTVLKFFEVISFDDDRHLMSKIAAPTLLITGSRGQEVPSGTGIFLRQEVKNSRLVEIPDADHFLFITRFGIVNPLIAGFLSL